MTKPSKDKPWTFSLTVPTPKHFCCGKYCPGLSYPASEMKHPDSCVIESEEPNHDRREEPNHNTLISRRLDDDEEYFRFHKNFPEEEF